MNGDGLRAGGPDDLKVPKQTTTMPSIHPIRDGISTPVVYSVSIRLIDSDHRRHTRHQHPRPQGQSSACSPTTAPSPGPDPVLSHAGLQLSASGTPLRQPRLVRGPHRAGHGVPLAVATPAAHHNNHRPPLHKRGVWPAPQGPPAHRTDPPPQHRTQHHTRRPHRKGVCRRGRQSGAHVVSHLECECVFPGGHGRGCLCESPADRSGG